jgi:hypothetical protein
MSLHAEWVGPGKCDWKMDGAFLHFFYFWPLSSLGSTTVAALLSPAKIVCRVTALLQLQPFMQIYVGISCCYYDMKNWKCCHIGKVDGYGRKKERKKYKSFHFWMRRNNLKQKICRLQGCQIFVIQLYQNGGKMTTKLPNGHTLYQMAVIYSKWP